MRLSFLTLTLLVTFAYAQKEERSASYYYEQALAKEKGKALPAAAQLFLKTAQLAKSDPLLHAKAAYEAMHYFNYTDEKDRAEVIKHVIQAVRYVMKAQRTDTLAGDLYFRGGIAYKLEFQVDSAMLCYNRAKKIYEDLYGEQSDKVSDCYQCIGDIYNSTYYDFNKSELFYEKALAIREKWAPTEVNLYLVDRLFAQLSATNRAQHDLDKALAYGLRNIAYCESLYQRVSSSPTVIDQSATLVYGKTLAGAYSYGASVYRDMGIYSEAKAYSQKAVSLNKKLNGNKDNAELADYLVGWGSALQQEGLSDEAILKYDQALSIYQKLRLSKHINYVFCFAQLGDLYLQRGLYDKARAVFDKGIVLVKNYKITKSGLASELYRSMAKYFFQISRYDSALAYCQQAVIASSDNFKSINFRENPPLESITLKDYSYKALLQKAEILNALYLKDKNKEYLITALKCFSLAEELLTESRASLDTDNSRWDFFDANFGLYEKAIALLYRTGNALSRDSVMRQAFRYMEGSKSKMFEDALNEAAFSDPMMTRDTLIDFLTGQKKNLHILQNEYKKVGVTADAVKKANISNSIIDTDRKIQRAEQQINEKYPSYLKIKYSRQVPDVTQLQDLARRQNLNVLEFFWGTHEVFAIGVSDQEVILKYLGSTEAVQKKIQPLITFLSQNRNSYQKESVAGFASASHELYKILLEPFKSSLNEKRLVIVPDGPIGQVPFEVLSVAPPGDKVDFRSLHYLIRDRFVSYSFSASYLLDQRLNTAKDPRLLAFGFTGSSSLRSGEKSQAGPEIAGSEIELQTLSKKFPNGRFYFGPEVTEMQFKKDAADYDIIHLAVHGKGDTEQNYSASLFFRDVDASQEDGELHWYELFGMRLKARLAVISSCESGIGKAYRGEGMLSMASAFAYAGCRNIVLGLWKVDDRVSVELMDAFYKYVQEGRPVDEALAMAKLNYLDNADELTANPRMWASLAAYGNQKVISSGTDPVFLWLAGLILLSIGGFALLRMRSN